ncbi:MAG: four-carbon acid sugar kinase family protein, partial [Bryobacteraceae bacterium]
EKAAEIVHRYLCQLPSCQPGRFFKKTDSTLRGNIGSELEAMASMFDGVSIVYVPAYPQLGRTVRNGILYVDGKPLHETEFASDRLNPAFESSVADLLATQTDMLVRTMTADELKLPDTPCILVCDGVCDEDIAMAARFISSHEMLIAAGPSALAKELARLWPPAITIGTTLPPVRSCLIVNGSLHPRSVAHCREAREAGISAVTALESMHGDWALLDTETQVTCEGSVRCDGIGKLVRTAVEHSDPDALLVFGGDTAYGIVKALGEPPLFSIGEVTPGVPVSRIPAADLYPQLRRSRDLYVMSKAGGFGDEGLVLHLKERFQTMHQGTVQ